MGSDQQFCLRWNNHQNTLVSIFDNLLESGTLVDCTLAAEGRSLQAHKVVLSACSPYFAMLLREHQDKFPILILKDIKFQELQAMMNYMYRGEVNITQEQLGSFLKAAESLQIRGLTDSGVENNNIFRDAGTTHSFHTNKKVPDSRKIVIPPTTVSQSRSPPVINTPQPKKYLKPPPPPALPAPPTENHHYNRSSATNNDLDTVSSPNIKRRKLLPPIKSEGLVVTPINPSPYNHIDANTCDVPSQLQSIPASEAKANVPSPSIPSSLESTQTDIIPVIKSEPSSGNGKSKSSVVETVKIKVEHSDEMYNNNDDTNDGSYTADENAESDSKDENHLGMPPGYEQSRSTNFDNLSDRSIGHDSNSALQDSQVFALNQYWLNNWEYNSKYVRLTETNPFSCQHCGKRYRWKSTLKRHESFECGGKEPAHKCPHCDYRAKQSGNLRVHIRKYHTEPNLNSISSSALSSVSDVLPTSTTTKSITTEKKGRRGRPPGSKNRKTALKKNDSNEIYYYGDWCSPDEDNWQANSKVKRNRGRPPKRETIVKAELEQEYLNYPYFDENKQADLANRLNISVAYVSRWYEKRKNAGSKRKRNSRRPPNRGTIVKAELEQEYSNHQYFDENKHADLANRLNISVAYVKRWYRERRNADNKVKRSRGRPPKHVTKIKAELEQEYLDCPYFNKDRQAELASDLNTSVGYVKRWYEARKNVTDEARPTFRSSSNLCQTLQEGDSENSNFNDISTEEQNTFLNDFQKSELTKEFRKSPYISINKETALSKKLNLSKSQIRAWFSRMQTETNFNDTSTELSVGNFSNNDVVVYIKEEKLHDMITYDTNEWYDTAFEHDPINN